VRASSPSTARSPDLTPLVLEYRICKQSFPYFASTYCQILSEAGGDTAAWGPFRLWPEQRRVARALQERRLLVILKARQLGLTWLVLAFALWLLLFFPVATVLLFSRRDDEAVDLLRVRLRGMYDHLPDWLKVRGFRTDNDHEWHLATDSRALAFPTTAGDSYTATLAVVDEADLCPDLDRLMRSVKPTVDAGGRMILLSRADKGEPESAFKRIYRAAKEGRTQWVPVFLPWSARPDRTAAWYEEQRADVLHRTGALDDLHEQYPATDAEALAPRSLDKRLAPAWLTMCYVAREPLVPSPSWEYRPPAIPNLVLYAQPRRGANYVVGGDPAEGNPTSDESALVVLDADRGEEVAALAGRFEPAVFAAHLDAVGTYFNRAPLLVERNNHGHAVLLWLRDNSRLTRLVGHDGNPGWLSNSKGKALLYDTAADVFRSSDTVLHSFATFTQLASVEGATLRAPEGEPDDRADAYALACVALVRHQRSAEQGSFTPYVHRSKPLYGRC
jgi:hypothetical protein